ncbi:MAG: N-acetyl-gamma-glutamyl-phosphate reductase [Planctomycetota bacterium]
MTARVAIVGVGGYTGQELFRILRQHPGTEIVGLLGSAERDETRQLHDVVPALADSSTLDVVPGTPEAILETSPDAVFLATPHEASAHLVPKLVNETIVLDLSGGFRLDAEHYPKHYGFDHPAKDVLANAIYGLVERARDALASADLIAVPGCYPTASILPLAPLVDAGLLDSSMPPIIDAISGVSGAGRKANLKTSFCEVSARPYGVLTHRHQPEIAKHTGTRVRFVAHLGPWHRGILATTHAQLADGKTLADARDALESAYDHEPFVRVLPDGAWPEIASVERTNLCEIGITADAEGHLVLASAIDNLTKGAAGQAVQCFNIRFGFDETAALGLTAAAATEAARG